jgi:hypothetical protein
MKNPPSDEKIKSLQPGTLRLPMQLSRNKKRGALNEKGRNKKDFTQVWKNRVKVFSLMANYSSPVNQIYHKPFFLSRLYYHCFLLKQAVVSMVLMMQQPFFCSPKSTVIVLC